MKTCAWHNCEEKPYITKSSLGKKYYQKYCKKHFKSRMVEAWKTSVRNKVDGERWHDRHGYILVKVAGSTRNINEHRLIMEEKLGRKLKKGESVHHINGIRDDNRPENLELWVGPIRYGQRATDIVCTYCGKSYWVGDVA